MQYINTSQHSLARQRTSWGENPCRQVLHSFFGKIRSLGEQKWGSPVVLWNITNFLFKRFSNITIIAGAGISIREDSDYITCTSGRLWQDSFISRVVASWPTNLKIVLLKRLSFFSQFLSPPYVFFFQLCDTSKVKSSADGLSESRTAGGESNLHIFVVFHAIYLFERGGDGILVGIVLLPHSFLALSVSFL